MSNICTHTCSYTMILSLYLSLSLSLFLSLSLSLYTGSPRGSTDGVDAQRKFKFVASRTMAPWLWLPLGGGRGGGVGGGGRGGGGGEGAGLCLAKQWIFQSRLLATLAQEPFSAVELRCDVLRARVKTRVPIDSSFSCTSTTLFAWKEIQIGPTCIVIAQGVPCP